MNKYAIINQSGIVENVVIWDGASNWLPPENTTLVDVTGLNVGPGYTHLGGQDFSPPEVSDQEDGGTYTQDEVIQILQDVKDGKITIDEALGNVTTAEDSDDGDVIP